MKKIYLVTMSPVSHRTSEENLGILYIAGYLRSKGVSVCIIDAWLENKDEDYVFNKIINDDVLFVGFSSYMTNTLPTINLIRRLKKYDKNIKIVCGGFGPTFYPKDYLLNGVDIVSLGEGEETLLEIKEYYEGLRDLSGVKNISYLDNGEIIYTEKRNLLCDLDILPYPSRDTLNVVMERKSAVNMVTSRGCSGNCEFCSVIAFFRKSPGKVWRTRSIDNIVGEIEELYKKGVKYIKFVDDSFIDGDRDVSWAREFASKIKEKNINVYLRGQIRADKITDEIMKYLSDAGFFSFACGIENASDKALIRMNKRANKLENQIALDIFKKYNIIVQMGYILFDKYTTIEELNENYEFLLKNDFVVTKGIFSEMFSAEGSKLNDSLKEKGDLIESSFIENNNKYVIEDENVRKVYNALKSWHKSHSEIYDKAIDPITAPKAIDMEIMRKFYNLVMNLRKKDLEIFKYTLECIKNEINIDINNKIGESMDYYNNVINEINTLYDVAHLVYDANKNPFI